MRVRRDVWEEGAGHTQGARAKRLLQRALGPCLVRALLPFPLRTIIMAADQHRRVLLLSHRECHTDLELKLPQVLTQLEFAPELRQARAGCSAEPAAKSFFDNFTDAQASPILPQIHRQRLRTREPLSQAPPMGVLSSDTRSFLREQVASSRTAYDMAGGLITSPSDADARGMASQCARVRLRSQVFRLIVMRTAGCQRRA